MLKLVLIIILLKLILIGDVLQYVRLGPGEIKSQGYVSLILSTNVLQGHGLIIALIYVQVYVHLHLVTMEIT